MKVKVYIGFAVFLALALVAMTVMNRHIFSSISDQGKSAQTAADPPPAVTIVQPKKEAVDEFNVTYALKAEDPKLYGIMNDPFGRQTWGSTQWEMYSDKVLHNADALDLESNRKLYTSLKKTPKKFSKRVNRIDQRILECEVILMKNPADQSTKIKLEALQKMKATLIALRHSIIDDTLDNLAFEYSAVSR